MSVFVFIGLVSALLCTCIIFQKTAEGGKNGHKKALISCDLCLSPIFLSCSEHFFWFVLHSNISFIEQQL